MPFGILSVSSCLNKSLIGDMSVNVKNLISGGKLDKYSELINEPFNLVKCKEGTKLS